MSQEVDLTNKLEEEIKKRIETIEASSYDFGPPLNRLDAIGIILVGVVCIVGLIWGMS
ncbi:Uncharacterised protein [Bacillus freudenreichii]|nr:Uncharacterised protein [Bacillus freudenreichii]